MNFSSSPDIADQVPQQSHESIASLSNSQSKHQFHRTFVCVEYPGVVENDSKMLQSLGGIQKISKVHNERNRRLELRFRQDDEYCRPTCADRQKVTGLVLSVKVRKKRSTGEIIEILPTVLGKVNMAYKFTNLCDFQYLAMDQICGKMECIYDKLVPSGLLTPDWFSSPASYFLPPATFSRMDTVQNYQYRQECGDPNGSVEPYHIGRTRRRRSGHAIFVSFTTTTVPLKPRQTALRFLNIKFLSGEHLQKMKELFDWRPVWSRIALMCVTGFSLEQMKYLLPSVAYYVTTGPFRIMWVRFGFDPRKHPTSRIYQSIDYRIRIQGGVHSFVKAKRSYTQYLLPYKSAPSSRPKTAVLSKKQQEDKPIETETTCSEKHYKFRPGTIPPSRQMFYQLCDIEVPEIQAMVERLPRIPPGAKCHDRLGWLPPGFAEQCRDIMNNLIQEQIKKNPQPSTSQEDIKDPASEEDQYSEEDNYDDIDNFDEIENYEDFV